MAMCMDKLFLRASATMVPLSATADALWKCLPHTTSSQLALLHEMRRTLPDALGARCDKIEKALTPDAIAPRPLAGPSHARAAAGSRRASRKGTTAKRAKASTTSPASSFVFYHFPQFIFHPS